VICNTVPSALVFLPSKTQGLVAECVYVGLVETSVLDSQTVDISEALGFLQDRAATFMELPRVLFDECDAPESSLITCRSYDRMLDATDPGSDGVGNRKIARARSNQHRCKVSMLKLAEGPRQLTHQDREFGNAKGARHAHPGDCDETRRAGHTVWSGVDKKKWLPERPQDGPTVCV
jgi:hypothetical protein